jgi:hypothetical protein
MLNRLFRRVKTQIEINIIKEFLFNMIKVKFLRVVKARCLNAFTTCSSVLRQAFFGKV